MPVNLVSCQIDAWLDVSVRLAQFYTHPLPLPATEAPLRRETLQGRLPGLSQSNSGPTKPRGAEKINDQRPPFQKKKKKTTRSQWLHQQPELLFVCVCACLKLIAFGLYALGEGQYYFCLCPWPPGRGRTWAETASVTEMPRSNVLGGSWPRFPLRESVDGLSKTDEHLSKYGSPMEHL